MITDKQELVLHLNGWTIECQSPLEIRHQDGSFATLNAAVAVAFAVEQGFVDNDAEVPEAKAETDSRLHCTRIIAATRIVESDIKDTAPVGEAARKFLLKEFKA